MYGICLEGILIYDGKTKQSRVEKAHRAQHSLTHVSLDSRDVVHGVFFASLLKRQTMIRTQYAVRREREGTATSSTGSPSLDRPAVHAVLSRICEVQRKMSRSRV